ncbi:MAG: DUF488 domain-containing protein [Kineosporiaceae bacterium]|nr:DUF488 domain-containing protein [Aeromicrobium sp.]
MKVFTVGHSTHPIDEFIGLISAHEVQTIADIRTIPKSRHNPQFGQHELEGSLKDAGLGYVRLESLGGLRHTTKASVNGAWRNASFRGYADYMQTPEFALGIGELLTMAGERIIAIMCAEAVPWRCHRSLVGDALLVRGIEVLDIMSGTIAKPRTLTSFAQVDGTAITYPPEDTAPPQDTAQD